MWRNVDTDRCISNPGRGVAITDVAKKTDPPKRSSASAVWVHRALGGRVGAIESRYVFVFYVASRNVANIAIGSDWGIRDGYETPLLSTPDNSPYKY